MVYREIGHAIHNQSSGLRKRIKAFRGFLGQPKEKASDSFNDGAKKCLERI